MEAAALESFVPPPLSNLAHPKHTLTQMLFGAFYLEISG